MKVLLNRRLRCMYRMSKELYNSRTGTYTQIIWILNSRSQFYFQFLSPLQHLSLSPLVFSLHHNTNEVDIAPVIFFSYIFFLLELIIVSYQIEQTTFFPSWLSHIFSLFFYSFHLKISSGPLLFLYAHSNASKNATLN